MKTSDSNKKVANVTLSLLLLLGSFYMGVNVGRGEGSQNQNNDNNPIVNIEKGKPEDVDFSSFWKAWEIIDSKYVSYATTTETQERVWGSIQGLAASLGDPYTVFFPPVEKKAFDQELSGNFEGVGMEIGIRDNILTVVAPLKGTPADRAGMQPGDKIIRIEDKITSNMTVEEAVMLIRGEKGTGVTLTIVRGNDEPEEVTIIRDVIDLPIIETETKDGVFIIRLYNFSAPAANEFRGALRDFINSNSDKLILDLRGNPGGFLDSAVDMASWFLPAGEVVVREDFGGNEESRIFRSIFGRNIFNENLKMAILVNGGSASASEILAGALSEHGVAKLVGTQTFGKGSVQELVPVTSDTSLKITIARWLTPQGKSISEGGLTPDVVVEMTEEDIENDRDPQLEKAIEMLKE